MQLFLRDYLLYLFPLKLRDLHKTYSVVVLIRPTPVFFIFMYIFPFIPETKSLLTTFFFI